MMLHQIEDDAGIDRAAARSHHEAVDGGESHGRGDAAAVLHRAQARTVAQVREDNPLVRKVRRELLEPRSEEPWIPERSATRLREADLNVFSKLGNQGLEGRLEPEAFTGREVRREDDLLDFLVGYPVDIEMARQPST